MTKSSKDRLLDVVPPQEGGVQANFCRTPGCKNFGVSPSDLPSVKQRWGQHSPYTLTGPLERAIAAGLSEEDVAALIKVLRGDA